MKKLWITAILTAFAGLALVATTLFAESRPMPKHLVIRASEMKYSPEMIHAKAGVPVHLTLINDGKVLHDFNLEGIAGVAENAGQHQGGHEHHAGHQSNKPSNLTHIAVEPGKSANVQFTPVTGNFTFYCSVPGHREAGMTGEMMVH